jgi:hypothetical protein
VQPLSPRLARIVIGAAAAAVAFVLVAVAMPAPLAAQTPPPPGATPVLIAANPIGFSGYVPRSGVSIVVMNDAGTPADVVASLGTWGCAAQTLALTNRGAYVMYIVGGPDFVNAAFPGYLSTGTALAIRCTAAASTAVATHVVDYLPAKPDASTAQDGSCFTGSVALPGRADAWRCTTGNQIHDPCFQLADGSLVCDANPATGATGFLLTLTGPLPAPNVPASAAASAAVNAWLVRLDDGTVCGINTGATGGVNGERANYGCPGGDWIFGDLIPGDANTPWTGVLGTMTVGPGGYQLGFAHQAVIQTIWR